MKGKTAFIFPGQGSQYSGMGKEIHEVYSAGREAFREVDQALEFPLGRLCFQGSEDELRLTPNTQPAILAVSVATLRVLEERNFKPDFVAGHSLGEYSALVCAGALTLGEAVRVVRKRGTYMQEAVPIGRGAMAAILGLDAEFVAEACEEAADEGVVSPANFNSPEQTVIAGEVQAVQLACEKAKIKGAKRCLILPVSAPFHCSLMAPARDKLAGDLKELEFGDLAVPLVTNVDAGEVRQGALARDALIRQVCAPVRWVESIRYLKDQGVSLFVEVGPGRVLTGLVKKTVPEAQTFNVDGSRGIEALASVFSGAKM
jgi:[acyl-carrier-protein] S-malonyltransferase